MSTQTIGFFAAFSVVLFGAYSCSPSQNDPKVAVTKPNPPTTTENSKTVPFPHDKDLDAYLTSARNFLLEVPKPHDKRFGVTRVPMLSHNVDSKKFLGTRKSWIYRTTRSTPLLWENLCLTSLSTPDSEVSVPILYLRSAGLIIFRLVKAMVQILTPAGLKPSRKSRIRLTRVITTPILSQSNSTDALVG